MTWGIDASHLGRYRKIARLLLKHLRADGIRRPGDVPADTLRAQQMEDGAQLAQDLEALGPAFVKLGQLLSTRTDLLPATYLAALARLQDAVEPFPFAQVEQIVRDEIGVALSKAFDSFDSEPVAAASLGQVHRATLRGGRPVVVKVQRPDVRRHAERDLEVLARISRFLDRHTRAGERLGLSETVEQFARTLRAELDYTREATHLLLLGRHLADFERIVVPRPIADYSSPRVLTMEHIPGVKVDEIHPVVLLERDAQGLADELFRAYMHQLFVHGFFHADPHPGNVVLTPDGRIALLDLGMVGRLGHELRGRLLRMVLDVGDGDAEKVVERVIELGHPLESFDRRTFAADVGDLVVAHEAVSVSELEPGRIVLRITEMAARCGLRMPPELSLVGKALLNLDGISRGLDPEFQPRQAIQRHASEILTQSMRGGFALSRAYASLLDARDFAERLPGQVGRILENLAENRLRLRVEGFDETTLIVALQKIANRIAAGLVLAALIVGAALMMRIETSWSVLGYPGLATLFFLLASAGGVKLLWDIFRSDQR